MKEEKIDLQNPDGTQIVLWKMAASTSLNDKNVFLTHGTFSDRKVLKGMVEYLSSQQCTCWILEWRNHGQSKKNDLPFDFETIANQDFKTAFEYLFETCNIKQVDCITHSGGGICLTIALIEQPKIKAQINSITLFACQAFGAGNTWSNYLKIYLGKYASKLLGKIPVRVIGGAEDEPYFFMKQWFDWNLTKQFIGKTGINYQKEMKNIRIPILAIYGAGDTFIAPPYGCELYLSSFQNEENEGLFCSIKNGFAEDYTHSRILHSRNARKEIYPKVLDWMTTRREVD